ncbi:MAG: DNA-3-methyladenine glycosylase I, partial [Chloroflexi bacterium]|nr:DNA-3-methyladenine glycosylase I [Chloroflexota bacterium]
MPEQQAPERIEPQSPGDYLEVMSKAVFQAGMSWKVVEAKWPGIRDAFRGFDAQAVAHLTPDDLDALTRDERVIRNRRKLEAVVSNAGRILELEAEHGTGRILRLTEAGGQAPEVLVDGLAGPVEFLEFEKNKLYVSEADAGRVSMHDIDSGERVVVVDNLDQPEGIDRLPDGRLLIAEVGARRLIAVDTDTGAIEVIAENLPVGLPPFMGTAKTFLPTDV